MAPKASTQKEETHAALVVSNETFKQPFKFSYTIKTTKQLRENEAANNWEVCWVVFGYQPDGKFKYIIPKPKGFEMGESLLNDKQEFLYTSDTDKDKFPINKEYKVEIRVENDTIFTSVNGRKYPPYKMFVDGKDQLSANGKIGLYVEDAEAVVELNYLSEQK